jgi:hypothetical protein
MPISSIKTLAGFPALNVAKVDLIETAEKRRRINPRRFDEMVEQIARRPSDGQVIVVISIPGWTTWPYDASG